MSLIVENDISSSWVYLHWKNEIPQHHAENELLNCEPDGYFKLAVIIIIILERRL